MSRIENTENRQLHKPRDFEETLIHRVTRVALALIEEFFSWILEPISSIMNRICDWTYGIPVPIVPPEDGLADVRPAGIQVGMPNTGATCWFNSLMKFLASSDDFDALLSQEDGDEVLTALRNLFQTQSTDDDFDALLSQEDDEEVLTALRNLFHTLRTADEGVIARKDYYQLLETMKRVRGFTDLIGRQSDPMDLLRTLFDEYFNVEKIRLGHAFVGENTPDCSSEESDILELDIPPEYWNQDEPLSITDLLYKKEPIEGRPYTKMTVPITLPETMYVRINRLVQNEKGIMKISNPLSFDDNEEVEFTLYKTEKGEGGKIHGFSSTSKTKKYRVTGCVEHIGGSGGGHYIAWERTSGGAVLKHNDSYVSLENGNIGRNGYLLRLIKI